MGEVALEPWIETYTGKKFYFLDPTPDMVDIEDIAHSLSHQCRFAGHVSKFYSVAEHSINVCNLVQRASRVAQRDTKLCLGALLHDASEAYLIDIPSPIKQHLPGYKDIELRVMRVIAEKYGFDWPPAGVRGHLIHEADQTQLKTEAKWLLPSKGDDWAHKFPTEMKHGILPKCVAPSLAKELFLGVFESLTRYELDTGRTEREVSRAA